MKKNNCLKKFGIIFIVLVLFCFLFYKFVPVKLEVTLKNNKLYQYDDLKENDLKVITKTLSNNKKEVKNFNIINKNLEFKNSNVTINYFYLHKDIKVECIPFKEIKSIYKELPPEGESFKIDNMETYLVFGDDNKKEVKDVSYNNNINFINENLEITTDTEYGCISSKITFKTIKNISLEDKYIYYIGDILDFTKLLFTYEDNSSQQIDVKDVEFIDDIKTPLVLGENIFRFKYHEKEYSLNINAKDRTNVSLAIPNLFEEIKQADYHRESDNILVTIKKNNTETGTYFLSHIIINSPDQIKGGLSNDSFGGTRELPTNASKRLNWVLGVNGSYFSYDTGEPACGNIFIKNGVIQKDGYTNGKEICLKNDGTLFSPSKNISASSLIEEGVVDIWGTADPLLIQNSQLLSIDSKDEQYPRTAIGMVNPLEYYVITAGDIFYEKGLTFSELQSIFASLGCQYARSLDGGGSSTLVFNNKLINNPACTFEREVVDFLYFLE